MPSHAATPLKPKEVRNSFEIKDLFGKKTRQTCPRQRILLKVLTQMAPESVTLSLKRPKNNPMAVLS